MKPIIDRNLHLRKIDTYIDPLIPRERAIITHGHADHARPGHKRVLATPDTIAIMKTRYGPDCAGTFQPVSFGERVDIDGVSKPRSVFPCFNTRTPPMRLRACSSRLPIIPYVPI